MKEKTYEERLEAINSSIATLHENISDLAAGLKKFSERKNGKASDKEASPLETPDESENLNAAWARFRQGLDVAGAKSKKIAKEVAAEVERHPLIGTVTTFSLGFLLARMLFRARRK